MSFIKRLPLLLSLSGISLAIGFAVPVVYEWGQKPASRSRLPAMERAALAALVVTAVVCVLVALLRRPKDPTPTPAPRKLQFGLRTLFAATTVSAIVVAAARWLDAPWSSALIVAAAAIVLGWSFLQDARAGWRAATLMACLFCPFVWMIAYSVPFGRTSGLITAIPFGPGLLPAELIRALLDSSIGFDGSAAIAAVIVIGEFALGAWLARRGGKLLIAYLLLVLLVSSVSSLGMHALYRA